MATAPKSKAQFGVLEGTIVYAKVAQPDTKYQSTDLEWSIEVIVDEDTAEKWDEEFQKQKSKKIKATDFEAKYRIPCPIEGVKNVYGIKLKRAATNDGVAVDEAFRPKVYLDDEDGERIEIGQSRLIANGSFGKVSYYISDNSYGRFSRLQNVLLTADGFKEYVSAGASAGPGAEFGDTKPVKTEAPKASATNARPVKPAKQVEPDTDLQDSPF